jgi:hypothetical protein
MAASSQRNVTLLSTHFPPVGQPAESAKAHGFSVTDFTLMRKVTDID